MTESEKRRGAAAGVWVLAVLVVGIVAGLVLAALPIGTTATSPGRGPGWHLQLSTASDYDVVLSTVGLTLLIALLVVYARVYSDTKANFSLGLIIVLLALLLQSILTSPLLFGAFGETSGGIGTFLAIADVFKVVAFVVFLYLSLE